jgi:hypothetical protein
MGVAYHFCCCPPGFVLLHYQSVCFEQQADRQPLKKSIVKIHLVDSRNTAMIKYE